MDNRLVNFLKSKEVDKGQPFTHTSKIKPMRRYYIEDNNLEDFYDVYNQVIFEGGIAGITEYPEPVVPLIVDIDFRCPLDNGLKRYYKPQHVRDIISVYHEIIEEIADEPNDRYYYCCVLEKEKPVSHQGRCKDGFHLHFPNFYTEQWVQKEYIRQEVIKRVEERKILSDIPMIETLDKVFDKNIPSVTWLMYGSRKDVNSESYKLTKIFNKDLELLRTKSLYKNTTGQPREYNLPRFLSIRQGVNPTPLIQDIERKKKETKTYRKREYSRNLDIILEELKVAEQLIEMLDLDRAKDYTKWIEIGWVLFNISEGHQKGLDLWNSFSEKCEEKYQEGQCDKIWNKMTKKNYSLGTLKHLARNDSPNEYFSWKDLQINSILYQGVSMAHNDIAKIMHMMFDGQYICADVEKEIWYEFRGHHWERSAKGIDLRTKLSNTLANKYASIASKYMAFLQDEEDQEKRQMYNSKVSVICKLIDKLKNNGFKTAIMKEAMEYFYDKDFIEKMDENPNLLVCENGVYDAETKMFRDGRPDDFCTKSTKIYYKEYEKDDNSIIEIENVLKKIFVEPSLFKFFKQTASDLIKGGNRHKIFVIWTGNGDNGKSVCGDLLEKTFGDYYYTPPTTMLTGKQQQSSGATAELMPCKGARTVVVSETDNADVLNCGTMKKLTGGDPFYARGMYKEPVKITPTFKLILHCNKMPNISAEDKASWNRIRVLPFDSTFVKSNDAPKTKSEQIRTKTFPMDKSLKERLNSLAEPFLWWLINAFEEYGDSDLIEPPEVRSATEAYHKTNDFYMQFIDERIISTNNKNDFITLTMIYTIFKEWYRDSYPGRKIPSREMVKESIEKKLGKLVKGIWWGYTTYDPDMELNNQQGD